jgi:hypothetical protein
VNRFEGRVRKVETAFPPAPSVTQEERKVGKLVIYRWIGRAKITAKTPEHTVELINRLREAEETLTREIRQSAERHAREDFQRYITEDVMPKWCARRGGEKFLAPVFGGLFADWEVPDLYRRRVAIRHCSIVKELIGAPDASIGPAEYEANLGPALDQILPSWRQVIVLRD